MRGYFRDMLLYSLTLHLLTLSHFGPITSFHSIDTPTTMVLADTLTKIGNVLIPFFRPWLPIRWNEQDDGVAKQ